MKRIYKAINEGLKSLLIDFGNNKIEKSQSVGTPNIEILNDAILTNGYFFLLKSSDLTFNDFIVESYENNIYIKSDIDMFGNHNNKYETGVIINVKDKLTLNIILPTEKYFFLAYSKFITMYLQSFDALKNEYPFFNLDTVNICLNNYKKDFHFEIDIYDLSKCKNIPSHINVVNIINDNDTFSNPINNDIPVIMSTDKDVQKNIDYKKYVDIFKKYGFKMIYISPSLIDLDTFRNNLYYDYNIPNLDDKIHFYGIKNSKASLKVFLNHLYILDAKDMRHYINKLRNELNEQIYNIGGDGDINKTRKMVVKYIVFFAEYLTAHRLPFYKIDFCYSFIYKDLTNYLLYNNINAVYIGKIIEPIVEKCDILGYSQSEIIDMIYVTCMYFLKNGLQEIK